ncbi:MAG: hypothetical protein RJB13_621 [Pseudomonadota bacterium]
MKFIQEEQSPWYRHLLFHWVEPLIELGSKKPVSDEDLFPLNESENSQRCGERFYSTVDYHSRNPRHAVLKTIWSEHKKTFFLISTLALVNLVFAILNPFLIREILTVLGAQNAPTPRIWTLALLLTSSALMANLSIHHVYHAALKLGMRIRAGLVYSIYKKAIKLSPLARSKSNAGEIVNLMASDAARIYNVASMIHLVWTVPLQTAIITIALFTIMGTSALAGLVVMIMMLVLSSGRAKKMMVSRKNLMSHSDQRVSLMSEILSAMRVIKLYCWENSFIQKIYGIRQQEIKELRSLAKDSALVNILFASTPLFVGFATFSMHLLSGKTLRVEDVFGSLAFFGILRPVMSQLPMVLSGLIDAKISLERINGFMFNQNVPARNKADLKAGEIKINSGTVSWMDGSQDLHLPDLHIKPGELILVMGAVGSGKSTFLHSLLNETQNSNSLISLAGKVAFAPQTAWIMQGTIKENIVFSESVDPVTYSNAIVACALEEDLMQLSAGDETEIGEKGVNLSGGQKQRIALARCVMSDADLILLDSSLSAVDSKTSKSIFETCILKTMRSKTRILVTQNFDHIALADRVLWCQDGRLRALTPEETEKLYTNHREAMSEKHTAWIPTHTSNVVVQPEELDLEKKQLTTPALSSVSLQSATCAGSTKHTQKDRLIIDEERSVGAVEKQHYVKYLSQIAPRSVAYILLAVFIFREIFNTGSDSWLAWWTKNQTVGVGSFLLIFAILGLIAAALTFTRTFYTAQRGVHAALTIHNQLLNGVLKAPMSFFERTPTGRILNRFGKDTEAIDQYIPNTLLDALTCLFAIVSTMTLISIVSPVALISFLPLSFFYMKIQSRFRKTSREVKRLESISRSPLYAHFSESLSGSSVIRAFNKGDYFLNESTLRFDGNQRAFYTMISINRWLGTRLELIGALVLGFTALSVIVFHRHISPSFAGVSLTYALLITGSLNWAVRMISELESSMNAIERVSYYSQTESENQGGVAQSPEWPTKGTIEFKQLTLRYRAGLPAVLDQLSLSIAGGERIGIVGRTGAGKSTLLQTLFRIVEPPDDSIFIDGVDIKTLPLEQLRSCIAVIPQEPVLFSGTLRENLDPFLRYTDADINDAIEKAHLKRMIDSLPGGLNQRLHEGGSNLSAGQRQQLCLARALLLKTKILLLDEATANVDAHTDALIQDTLQHEFNDCTVLCIAHRINTVMHCDRVAVLRSGRVAEFASPKELISNKESLFASYWAQSRLELRGQ